MSNTRISVISLRTPDDELLDESILAGVASNHEESEFKVVPDRFYLARANDQRQRKVGARRDFADASAALDR